MTTPNVSSFSVLDQEGRSTRLTVSTDIVDYLSSARTFGREDLASPEQQGRFQRRVIAIPDRRSSILTPMILTIGNRNQLSLVRQDTTHGWQRIDLQKAFGASQVHALGAAWTEDDRITIAVAVADANQPSISRVYVAYDLSSQQTDWEHVAWIDCGTRSTVRLEAIRVLDEGDRSWTIVLAGDEGANEAVYLLKRKQKFNTAFVFNPAVTMQEIFDFEVGVHPMLGGGLHVLGMSGGTRVLAFRPFPRYDKLGRITNIPPIVVLPCPAGATVLDSGMTREDGSDLFIAGQGTQRITALELDEESQAKVEILVPAALAANVEDLVVGENTDGSIAVWTLLQNGELNVVKRSTTGWGQPLCLRKNVQEIAPIQGDDHATTSLVIVYTNGKASYLWQDAGTGVWQESPILVADAEALTRVPCYGTSLRVLDELSLPQSDRTVIVSASVLCSVILNGETVFLGPNLSIEAKTDSNGSISLFDAVRSLTPSIYRFAVDQLNDAIDINPAAGVQARLQHITADDLRSATYSTPTGTSMLLPESFRTGTDRTQVDAISASLNQAAQLTGTTSGILPGVRQVALNASYQSALRLDAIPEGYQWGIEATAQGVKTATPAAINRLLTSKSAGAFFSNLGDTIVDFFEGVGDRIKAGAMFVIRKTKEAFEFVCQLGDRIKRFILKTVEEVGAFFTWLWEQIKTGLENVWDFLKFAFDWNDILLVRDAMVKHTDESLRGFQASISKAKTHVNAGFDIALHQVETWRSESGLPPSKAVPPANGTSIFDDLKSVTKPIQALLDQATGNSVVAWVMQRMQSIASEIITIEGPNPATETVKAMEGFLAGLASDGVTNLLTCWQQIQVDLESLFSHQLPTARDLNFKVIRSAIISVGANALMGLLREMRDLLLRTIDLLQDMIGVLRDILFLKVRFPFVEKLVKLVLPNVQLDASFRLIDGLMLLFSIPATIAYKIILGEAPIVPSKLGVSSFTTRTASVTANVTASRLSIPETIDTAVDETSRLIDKAKKFSFLAGLVSSFGKLAFSMYQTQTAADPSKFSATTRMTVGSGLMAIGVGAEYAAFHPNEGVAVEAVEWTMLITSSLLTLKGLGTAIGAKVADSKTAEQVNDGVDLVGYVTHFLFQTVGYSLLIDDSRKSNDLGAGPDGVTT